MMKLHALDEVNRLAHERGVTIASITAVESGLVQIWIGGQLQNDALHAAASASMLTELRARKSTIERKLRDIGVSTEPRRITLEPVVVTDESVFGHIDVIGRR